MAEKIAELENIEPLLKILNEEGELNNKNLFQMMLARQFKNKELVNKDGDLFLTVDSLIRINNYIADSHNIQLRRINVNQHFITNNIWILPELNQNYTDLLINSTKDK